MADEDDDAELFDLQTIETGDSVKVKQVLDEAIVEAINNAGYQQNFYWENIKLLLMLLSCVFAMAAQFYPIPFPDSRPLLGICCASYFILSVVLQYVISYVDKDTIMITNPVPGPEHEMRVRSSFPRYQHIFTLTIQPRDEKSPNQTIGQMYVGKYFTEKGEFDQVGFMLDVRRHVDRYQHKKYETFVYNHKTKPEKKD
jgi:signal peptidase complex subunit 2